MSKLIPLTQGQHAIVDDEDYNFLMQWRWCYQSMGKGYAGYFKNSKVILMHRVIMNAPANMEVDHKNGNGLDCQRHNMRLATHAENLRNRPKQRHGATSQYIGVSWYPSKQRWCASVHLDGKRFYAGYHKTEIDAARARDAKAKELHGEFARLNFPDGNEKAAP